MKSLKEKLLGATFGLLVLSACTNSAALADAKEEHKVRAAVDQFYVALNSMFAGDVERMNDVWSHADDVVYMGPDGGFQVGWTAVFKEWKEQAAMKLGGKVEPENVTVTIGDKLAVAYDLEKGENKDAKGNAAPVSIRATNVFRRGDDGAWKMISHHTDLIPGITKRSIGK
jgi:ketosteroid isomerase-like protein